MKVFTRLLFTLVLWAVAGIMSAPHSLAAGTDDATAYFSSPVAAMPPPDSPEVELPWPWEDRRGDFYTDPLNNPISLDQPDIFDRNIEYDHESGEYRITEEYGDYDFRDPTTISFDDFVEREFEQSKEDYWIQRSKGVDLLGRSEEYELDKDNELLDRFLEGSKVEIRPQGSIELLFGGTFQKVENPTLPEEAQSQGGFDFDMNINMSVVGQIGDKMKLNTNYNTQASFDFENQINLNYEGSEDEIVQNVEAGNVDFNLPTSLITGSQSLFGLKSKLKFGRLTVTSVVSQQKSKRENIQIEGGAQTRDFEVSGMEYDENRHFFLGHYFRDHYEEALSTMPVINSQVVINRVEVWVTNSTGETQNTRDVVGFMDLGETDELHDSTTFSVNPGPDIPANSANTLYKTVLNTAGTRSLNSVVNTLTNQLGMEPITSFEKTRAHQLPESEYTLNPKLGYISLNQSLKPDEVLAVAFEFTYQGETYRVGEFSQDVPVDPQNPNVLFLKLLKSTSARPKLPIWDLMMKNIYSLGAYQINSEDFFLDIFYQDPGGGAKRYIPEGKGIKNNTVLQLMELDRLNNQNDPQPDGVFDFVPGITINPQKGRIIFPVVEPFGSHLREEFIEKGNDASMAEKYTFQKLYDSTKIVAEQFPQFDRFVLKGRYKSEVSSEIYLGTFNLPKGSVNVTAGGQRLQEGQDYTIDYNLGRIKIINDGILNSGAPINVSFENNNQFGFQLKTMIGNRFDYWVNDNLTIGATQMHLSERPYTQKVNYGNDPISNSIYGMDVNYNKDLPGLTRIIDKFPLLSTEAESSLNLVAEGAYFNPGHNNAIDNEEDKGGVVYIDDFEGTRTYYDLKFPYNSWSLASTPKGATNENGNELFPEAALYDSLPYGYNRAKLIWYNMDPLFTSNRSSTPNYVANNADCRSSHYVRTINEQEIFDRESQYGSQRIATFDMAYYPSERGPYNFESNVNGEPGISRGLNPDGTLKDPETRWGGIMRSLETNDFEAANVEYIDFWVMDPFDDRNGSGEMYINLGNVSEDVLKDSRNFFENGLPENEAQANLDTTRWGVVPNTQSVTNAFSTDPEVLKRQDKGYDGLSSEEERDHFGFFLSRIQTLVNNGQLSQEAASQLEEDPSSDDFVSYLSPELADAEVCVLPRYKNYDGPEGNTYATVETDQFQQGSNLPNSEDLNRDNTLNENEEYYQYRVPMYSGMDVENHPYITDVKEANVGFQNGSSDAIKWYHFQIPVYNYDSKVGGIQDFRSIRFMRMFLTGFQDSLFMRFAKLQLVRNQWRRYRFSLAAPGEYFPGDGDDETFFNVSAVNIEENSNKEPIPYMLPPGVRREQFVGNNAGNTLLQNEQSLQLEVCGLKDGDAKAVYKELNFDFRQYKRMEMFIHAEAYNGNSEQQTAPLEDGEMRAFVRMGSDFTENYYEISLPLEVSEPELVSGNNMSSREEVWPEKNMIDIALDSLRMAKQERNRQNIDRTVPYTVELGDGRTITIIGNPNLGQVEMAMIGLQNPKNEEVLGRELCGEIWVNEFRLVGIDEQGGGAGLVRADVKLADIGDVQLSGSFHTIGFGQVEQRANDRFRDDMFQYNAATNLRLGKFFPENFGLQIPMYASISESFSRPEYDPYDFDIPVEDKVAELQGEERSDYLDQIQDYTRIKSLNFTNVRKSKTGEGKSRFYDISNFNFTYAFNETLKRDPITKYDLLQRHRGGFAYNFSRQANHIEPLKNILPNSKWLKLLRDFNFNPLPNNYSFRTDLNRQYGELVRRDIYGDALPDTTYNKHFTWDRFYDIGWDLTKSIQIQFSATTNSRIDEPAGKIDTEEKKDSVWTNIKNLGRVTNYRHNLTVNYNVPFNKIPVLDWMNARAGYGADYNWEAASLVVDSFGNNLSNSRSIRLNADANMSTLYNKIGILRRANSGGRQRPGGRTPRRRSSEQESQQGQQEGQNEGPPQMSGATRTALQVITGLKRVTFQYNQQESSYLPGYTPKAEFLGLSNGFESPGWMYVSGFQPDSNMLNQFAANDWMTRARTFNFQHTRSYTENYDVKATFEPLDGMRLDLNWSSSYTRNFSEFFKYTENTGDGFEHLNPQWRGSYNISYLTISTMFDEMDSARISDTYKQFEANRIEISHILGNRNPLSNGSFEEFNTHDTIRHPEYADGYGPYSQSVLIPAFIAAYSGDAPSETPLEVFNTKPRPNWRFSYSGLSKIKPLDKIFSSLNIKHGYSSNLSVNSFDTDFSYRDSLEVGHPSSRDTLSGNFFPLYTIPNVTISEQFSPLIGIDFTLQSGLNAQFQYKKGRSLSLSLVDYQLIETKSMEITLGAGYRFKGLRLPFKFRGEQIELDNELTLKLDFSYRDDITVNYKMDQNASEPTQGAISYSISTSAEYVVNNRLSVRLYFDHKRTEPYTSVSYPISNTNGGIAIRFTLAE